MSDSPTTDPGPAKSGPAELEPPNGAGRGRVASVAAALLQPAIVSTVAVILGLAIAAVLITLQGNSFVTAYGALIEGGLGGTDAILRTLQKATPLIFGGLAVAFAFKAGLFNIGGQGQLLVGAVFAAAVGFGIDGLPTVIHLPLALVAGALAGAGWGAIAGVLKATTGAHEVIVTIMLNFVAGNLTDWLSSSPWQDDGILAQTPVVADSAALPTWGAVPTGFLLAIVAAIACWALLEHTTYGFEVRSVGANRAAARYAGISVGWILASTMAVSGLLAGMGGTMETLGVEGRFSAGVNIGLGFQGIAIALLARAHPIGVIPAGLLIGVMEAGAAKMQFESDVPTELIDVMQALILFFVAAPVVIRWLLRMRGPEQRIRLGAGWGASQ